VGWQGLAERCQERGRTQGFYSIAAVAEDDSAALCAELRLQYDRRFESVLLHAYRQSVAPCLLGKLVSNSDLEGTHRGGKRARKGGAGREDELAKHNNDCQRERFAAGSD